MISTTTQKRSNRRSYPPEGNCYARLSGTQSITRDFPLVSPGCVSFYYAWDGGGDGYYEDFFNDFMRVSYVDEFGAPTTLDTLDIDGRDTRSWQDIVSNIPDAAVGSVLKLKGLVQNVGDTDENFNSFLELDIMK